MMRSSRNLVMPALVFGAVGALILACGEDSTFGDGNTPPPVFGEGEFGDGGNKVDLYANDPLPAWCGPGEDPEKGQITGTEKCPSDKNKPGCGCTNLGEEAPCWEGLRRHRNLGICKDGKTKCIAGTETSNVWGPCEGQVLPNAEASGADGCSCFSIGEWRIKNTNVCFSTSGAQTWAHSTVLEGDKITHCYEPGAPPQPGPGVVPPGIWSTSTLKVDCAGDFKLVYRVRAGDYKNPKPDDCIVGEAELTANYPTANVVMDLPPLPTWAGADQACARKFEVDTPADVNPGYGEMIVRGKTVRCDEIDDGNSNDFVFHRLPYCARICRTEPSSPACVACASDSNGTFD